MNTLNKLINLMLGLICLGFTFKLASNLLAIQFNIDDKHIYLKKIKNCLTAVVIAASIFTIKSIVEYYFAGILA